MADERPAPLGPAPRTRPRRRWPRGWKDVHDAGRGSGGGCRISFAPGFFIGGRSSRDGAAAVDQSGHLDAVIADLAHVEALNSAAANFDDDAVDETGSRPGSQVEPSTHSGFVTLPSSNVFSRGQVVPAMTASGASLCWAGGARCGDGAERASPPRSQAGPASPSPERRDLGPPHQSRRHLRLTALYGSGAGRSRPRRRVSARDARCGGRARSAGRGAAEKALPPRGRRQDRPLALRGTVVREVPVGMVLRDAEVAGRRSRPSSPSIRSARRPRARPARMSGAPAVRPLRAMGVGRACPSPRRRVRRNSRCTMAPPRAARVRGRRSDPSLVDDRRALLAAIGKQVDQAPDRCPWRGPGAKKDSWG